MTEFHVGDKVEVFLASQPYRTYSQEESDTWNGTRGTVTHDAPEGGVVGIRTTDGRDLRFYDHDLILLPAFAPPRFTSVGHAEAWLEANAR